jgi:hypothetical protein
VTPAPAPFPNTVSGSDGAYSVSYLTPGSYIITVEKFRMIW